MHFNNISLFCTSTWFLNICLHIVWILFQIMLPSWLLSRTLAVYWQVMWCAKLLKQMLALTHGTTLQRLPEEAASEQRKRPISLFPLKWFCMVLLACDPAKVANCTKLRYPYIYIYIPRTGLVLVLNEGIAFPIHKNCNVKIRLLVQNTDLTLFGDI